MRKLIALFENEAKAQSAIDKLEPLVKDIDIELFCESLSSPKEDVFLKDAHIIGSPSSFISQLNNGEYEQTQNTTSQAGLSAFCFFNLVATGENSLIESTKEELSVPYDSYGAGLMIKAPGAKRDFIKKVLAGEGAKILNQ